MSRKRNIKEAAHGVPRKQEPALTPEQIRCLMEEINPEALTPDGFDGNKFGYDEAIMGYVEQCGKPAVYCYDAQKMAEILVGKFNMSWEAAYEWLEFNTFGAYISEHQPMWFYRFQG